MKNHFRVLLLIFGVALSIVSCKKDKPVEPDHSIVLPIDTLKVSTGESVQLTTKNYSADQLTWTSSDTAIVKVNAAGLVTAFKQGNATITIKSKAYGNTAIRNVVVQEATILGFSNLTIPAASSKQLLGQHYAQSEFTWSSSDTTIATVGTTGLITALKPGSVTITIKTKTYSVSETLSLTVTDAKLTDVGVGADGSVFVVGSDTVNSAGDHSIFKFYNSQFHKIANGSGVRVAVSPQGAPWIVNNSNQIFNYSGGAWAQVTGSASDIGIGANGSVFAVSTQVVTVTGGYAIIKWNGSGWDTMPYSAGVRIAVDPYGVPWVVNLSNLAYQYGGYLWNQIPGVAANDVTIGGDGSVYVSGADTGVPSYSPSVYKYNGGIWSPVTGPSNVTDLSADANGKIWYLDKSGVLHSPVN
ncbi:MAG: Ig-like domain-containing protein [Bacteroidetes bacterium]|jgi:uncharacterized protein YjdB|nr:Ig-like domain-containing protein [Bacteroidota bacterium]